jgi:hypothetical protein
LRASAPAAEILSEAEGPQKIESSWTCKPNSVRWIFSSRTAIPLGRALLFGSSDLPEGFARRAGTHPPLPAELPPYLVLLRVGFALPTPSLKRRCALTAPFHPYLAVTTRRYVFCGTFRRLALTPASRTFSGTLLCGVRTFLPRPLTRQERPSGPAAYVLIIFVHKTRAAGRIRGNLTRY